MRTIRQFLSIALLSSSFASLGCGASEPAATSPTVVAAPSPEVKSSGADPYALCVAMFERQRACTDTFLPALVDARVRADVPPGIAAADRDDGRDALVATAREEWKQDSTDESIAATCRKIADSAPSDMTGEVKACLDASGCDAFSTCAVDIVSAHWQH
jgi:hypothetical protein